MRWTAYLLPRTCSRSAGLCMPGVRSIAMRLAGWRPVVILKVVVLSHVLGGFLVSGGVNIAHAMACSPWRSHRRLCARAPCSSICTCCQINLPLAAVSFKQSNG